MYALLQLLVLVTLWLAYEGFTQNKARWRWAALLAYLGATLTHFVAVTLTPPLFLAAAAIWWQRRAGEQGSRGAGEKSPLLPYSPALLRNWKLWLEVAALILILLIAFLVKRAGQPKGIEALGAANALPGIGQVLAIYGNLSFNLTEGWQAIAPFYLTLPALIFTPFALIAMIMGGLEGCPQGASGSKAGRKACFSPALFYSIILVATSLEMIFFVSPDRRDDKYLFMLLPVLLLLGAYGMKVMGNWLLVITNLQLPISNLLPLLISGLILTLTQPAVQALLANTGDDYDSAFGYVRDHWQSGDAILSGTPAAAALYLGRNDFYGVQRRGGYDYRLLAVNGRAVDRWLASPAIRTAAELHQILAHQRVWLVLERWGLQREYYDLPFQQQLLAQTEYISQAQGIFILRSQEHPQPLRLDPTHQLEASFGGQVYLTGYTLEPEQPAPGQPLRLTLYWQALAAMPHDYTVFVHLRQARGATMAQADHRPLDSRYPTSLWPIGEIIRESSQLILPANLLPGDYELWVGLYLLETGVRLPLQNDPSGENAAKLGQVTVKP
jgi:hypothetical protein